MLDIGKKFLLGITGGVGAGKSTVLQILQEEYGAFVISCDDVGRMLQQPGEACFEPVVRLFGTAVLDDSGQLDRGRIASAVFADRGMREKLENIVHPAVRERVMQMAAQARQQLIVIESAILLQAGYDSVCDSVWHVSASEEVRKERLIKSRGYTEERIRNVFSVQPSDKWYRDRASFIIENNGADPAVLSEQIKKGLEKYGILHHSQRQQR